MENVGWKVSTLIYSIGGYKTWWKESDTGQWVRSSLVTNDSDTDMRCWRFAEMMVNAAFLLSLAAVSQC